MLAASSTVFLVLIAVGLFLDRYPPYVLLVSLLCAAAVVGIAGLARVLKRSRSAAAMKQGGFE